VLAEQCSHCRADVRGVVQTAVHAYDRIERILKNRWQW
jgi:hypothetical protein